MAVCKKNDVLINYNWDNPSSSGSTTASGGSGGK